MIRKYTLAIYLHADRYFELNCVIMPYLYTVITLF